MNDDPMSRLKAELASTMEKRKILEKALAKLVAERQRTAESLNRLAREAIAEKKPSSSALLGVCVLCILAIPLTGVVLSRFWSWFLVEPFDLPSLSAVGATGIYLLFLLFGSYSKIDSGELSRVAVGMAMRLGIIWFLGWCLHWLV